jgi:hypothetical protein
MLEHGSLAGRHLKSKSIHNFRLQPCLFTCDILTGVKYKYSTARARYCEEAGGGCNYDANYHARSGKFGNGAHHQKIVIKAHLQNSTALMMLCTVFRICRL